MNNTHRGNYGFSLIEVLIVIAIIGLLTTVILANFSSGRSKAQASQILTDFEQIETALIFMALNENVARWWTDNDNPNCAAFNPSYAPVILGNETECETSPSIASLITYSPANGLAKYLSVAPTSPVGSGTYQYDRDSVDAFDDDDIPGNNCAEAKGATPIGNVVSSGANLLLWGMANYPEIFDAINVAVDGEESLSDNDKRRCGKIRYVKTSPSPANICTGAVGENCAIFYMLSANGKL